MSYFNKNMLFDNKYFYDTMWQMENKMCWHMNELCNLKCEYCYFDFFEKENALVGKYSPTHIYESFKKTGRNWHLFLSGGEPFVYPNFNELISLLQKDHGLLISTNLTLTNRIKSFAEEIKPHNIHLFNASLHITTKNEKSLKTFINNYHLLTEKGFKVMVSYVTYPSLFSRIEKDFQMLRDEGINYIHPLTYQGVYENKIYPGSYTKEEAEIIQKLSMEPTEMMLTLNKMNFKGKKCKAGKNMFYMELNGEVYDCATLRNSCGNLFEGTFVPKESPITCPVEKCLDSCIGITSLVEKPKVPSIEEEYGNTFKKQLTRLKEVVFG